MPRKGRRSERNPAIVLSKFEGQCINTLYNHDFPALGNRKRMPDPRHRYTGSHESIELSTIVRTSSAPLHRSLEMNGPIG